DRGVRPGSVDVDLLRDEGVRAVIFRGHQLRAGSDGDHGHRIVPGSDRVGVQSARRLAAIAVVRIVSDGRAYRGSRRLRWVDEWQSRGDSWAAQQAGAHRGQTGSALHGREGVASRGKAVGKMRL